MDAAAAIARASSLCCAASDEARRFVWESDEANALAVAPGRDLADRIVLVG